MATLHLFDNLGFVVHPTKSEFIPEQKVVFLGFVLDSVKMQISLTPTRHQNMLESLQYISQHASKVKSRDVARTLGYMVSSFPSIPFGAAHEQKVAFLGFVLDSVKMQISLTPKRHQNMLECLQYISQHASKVKSRDVTRTLGYMVSSFPAIPFGAAHEQKVVFLGFVFDSVKMQISLTPKRHQNMLECLQYISQHASKVKSRDVTRTLGYMVSSFPAVPFGAAHEQKVVFLGFVFDSVKMQISLTPKRHQNMLECLQYISQHASKVKSRDVARTLGYMVSSFPSIPFGAAHEQKVAFLGFVLDSVKMQISLTPKRHQNMSECLQYISQHASKVKSHDDARTLGYMVSSFPAIPFGAAHYRWLEQDKIKH